MSWRCDCPICKLFVHPILNRLTYTSQDKERSVKNKGDLKESGVTKVAKTERVELRQKHTLEAKPASTTVPQQVVAQQALVTTPQQQERVERKASNEVGKDIKEREENRVEVSIPKEVYERIESLETEVDKIKKYVKASIDGIKATLVDLRSAMAELSNPFNILRKYADVFLSTEGGTTSKKSPKDDNEVGQQRMVPQVIPVVVQVPQSTPINVQETQTKELDKEVGKGVSKEVKQELESKQSMDPEVYNRLVLWVNKILERIPPERFSKLIDNYVSIGIIDKELGEALKKISLLVYELKNLGLDINEQSRLLKELLAAIRGDHEVSNEERGGNARELLDIIENGEKD